MPKQVSDGVEQNKYHMVRTSLKRTDLYAQLAEECCELAQAALKINRILGKTNDADLNMWEAENNLIEEYTDVRLVADILNLEPEDYLYDKKLRRWENRINAKKEN